MPFKMPLPFFARSHGGDELLVYDTHKDEYTAIVLGTDVMWFGKLHEMTIQPPDYSYTFTGREVKYHHMEESPFIAFDNLWGNIYLMIDTCYIPGLCIKIAPQNHSFLFQKTSVLGKRKHLMFSDISVCPPSFKVQLFQKEIYGN